VEAAGMRLGNIMMHAFPNVILGTAERDRDIENVQESIRIAGRLGIPVVEYNFFGLRNVEGLDRRPGRGGATYRGFDDARVKDRTPLPKLGATSDAQMWERLGYFLKAVVPVAVEAHVRLALHPNDPPAPISRGSQQIMGTVAGWKKLISIVDSPANGITFDCGVTREMGENPIEVCRYFASRDRINHVHFRNVIVVKPYERYNEVWIDEGMNNMFAVMKELVKNKYAREIYPEHPRRLDYDAERGPIGGYPGGGGYAAIAYNVGYARAMLQAALTA